MRLFIWPCWGGTDSTAVASHQVYCVQAFKYISICWYNQTILTCLTCWPGPLSAPSNVCHCPLKLSNPTWKCCWKQWIYWSWYVCRQMLLLIFIYHFHCWVDVLLFIFIMKLETVPETDNCLYIPFIPKTQFENPHQISHWLSDV